MNYNVEHFNLYCGMWRLLRFSCFYPCFIFFFLFFCSLNPFAHLHTTSRVVTREECVHCVGGWAWVGVGVGLYMCVCVCDACKKNGMGTRELNDILLAHCHIEFHAQCLLTGRQKKRGIPNNMQHSICLYPSLSLTLSHSHKICSQELSPVSLPAQLH